MQEGVHWAILNGESAVCIDRIESPRALGTMSRIGRASALNAGSVGKILLAFQPEEVRERLLATVPLKRMTDATITTADAMREAIARIRSRGYCISLGEGEEDMACIAAPIFDHLGQIVAGLSVGGPIQRFRDPGFVDLAVAEILKATRRISERLGCPGIPGGQHAA